MEERLEALERRLRRRTFIQVAVFVLFAAVVYFGFYSVDYSVESLGRDVLALHEGLTTGVKSQQFLVLDEKGEIRGYITGADGRGVLMLLDGAGRTRIVADAGAKSPGLELIGEDGAAKISLLLDPAGNSVLVRAAKADSQAAIQAVVGEPGPRVRLMDERGVTAYSAP